MNITKCNGYKMKSLKSDPLKFFFGFMVHLGVVILTVYNSMKHKQAKKTGSL